MQGAGCPPGDRRTEDAEEGGGKGAHERGEPLYRWPCCTTTSS